MAQRASILLVDDDEWLRSAATKVLAAEGYRVIASGSVADALDQLARHDPDLMIADLVLPDLDGLALLQRVRQLRPHIEVVMITGHGSVEAAVEAMRQGAYDFIEKPLDSTALLKTVAKALEKQRLFRENVRLRQELQQQRGLDAILGNCPAIQEVKRLVRQIAATDISVLIQGETGTGKEIVADALHALSQRRDRPLIKISSAAIPDNLLESELFGYERGAFTGATAPKPGKFELADGGSLFLDEIAEMSPPLQAKLLRVLQDGRGQRLGSTREWQADVRVLSATHSDIPTAIAEHKFRQDLYYRINAVTIWLPPLRERGDDVELLAGHFLRRFAKDQRKSVHAITPAALDQLRTHSWPGNVRELQHVIQRAVALANDDAITDFSFAPRHTLDRSAPSAATGPTITIPIGTTVDDATRQLVRATIRQCSGNKLKAARILDIPPRSMYRHFSGDDTL